jgi:hypothetical protein
MLFKVVKLVSGKGQHCLFMGTSGTTSGGAVGMAWMLKLCQHISAWAKYIPSQPPS